MVESMERDVERRCRRVRLRVLPVHPFERVEPPGLVTAIGFALHSELDDPPEHMFRRL
jgi:hypothetical protein